MFKDASIKVHKKALELGYDLCGIIKIDDMEGYATQLEDRIKSFPESTHLYKPLFNLAFPKKNYEWAKSVIICASRYGKYKIPKDIDNLIGRYYLYDYRHQEDSTEYSKKNVFQSYLKEIGLNTANDDRGITAARWAAAKAGLGIIRKNNFLYTTYGSWVWLDAWLVDEEMEYIESPDISPCPNNCTQCIDSCPTGALAGPFSMNRGACITQITALSLELPPEHLRDRMGSWLYGCDECQNACPMNKDKWDETENYPGINELAKHITLETIFEMDEKTFLEVIGPKFWYIKWDNIWLWKANALRAMVNDYDVKYAKHIKNACLDKNDKVKAMGQWACMRLGI